MSLFSEIVKRSISLTHEFSQGASIKVPVQYQETVNRAAKYISAQFNVTTAVYRAEGWIYLRIIINETHYQ